MGNDPKNGKGDGANTANTPVVRRSDGGKLTGVRGDEGKDRDEGPNKRDDKNTPRVTRFG